MNSFQNESPESGDYRPHAILIFQPYILHCIIIFISFCICIETDFIVKKNYLKVSILKYGKTGNKKHATCFATSLQNELNSDVARFTTYLKPGLHQIRVVDRFEHGWY